jgi:apolipoprotein N-acyltransferase
MNSAFTRAKIPAASVVAGLLLAASLPPWGWWPLALVGIAAVDFLIADQARRVRFRRGFFVGIGLYFPSLAWMVDLTSPGYVIASIAYAALVGGALCLVPATAPGRWLALPGAVAVTEILRWSWPFGGVPLSSLAIGQVDGPLAPVLRVGGAFLVVQVTVIAGLVVATAWRRRWVASAAALGAVCVALLVAGFAPRGHETGEIDVALVQGGGPQGTRARDTDMREVFERHHDASQAIDTPVDLVVWPENVIDVEGEIEDNVEGEELADLARQLDAPLVAGVVAGVDDDHFENYSVVFEADGSLGERYDKVHRVPFGEYVPLRDLVEPFAGDDLTMREAVPGEDAAYLDTEAGRLSVAISWEIFFGDRVREGVGYDAEVVINPTNGSSYSGTMVQTQQVASSRMRAIENGRWVLQVAPTGFTAVIDDHGEVRQRSSISERAVLQDTVGTRSGQTIYTRLGVLPGWVVALASLGGGWAVTRLRRRPGTDDEDLEEAVEVPSAGAEPATDAEVAVADGGTGGDSPDTARPTPATAE